VTATQIAELALAALLVAVGVWQYRKRSADGARYGSQGAVILFVVAALLAIHGLGLLDYRPSPAELGQ